MKSEVHGNQWPNSCCLEENQTSLNFVEFTLITVVIIKAITAIKARQSFTSSLIFNEVCMHICEDRLRLTDHSAAAAFEYRPKSFPSPLIGRQVAPLGHSVGKVWSWHTEFQTKGQGWCHVSLALPLSSSYRDGNMSCCWDPNPPSFHTISALSSECGITALQDMKHLSLSLCSVPGTSETRIVM